MTRFGMNVVLAHPPGYEIMPEVEAEAAKHAEASGGSFARTHNMQEAFTDADVVYPKSWAPFAAMEKRTELFGEGDMEGIAALEKELLAQNAEFQQWECNQELMQKTAEGQALYLHCLPADITGVSCAAGEVAAAVFDRYRDRLYHQASYKPYIIAAMILLARFQHPADTLQERLRSGRMRVK
jgi:ornithine carbamoyltransferase